MSSDNQELLNGVAQAAQSQQATAQDFDLADWLTPDAPKEDYVRHEDVTLVLDMSLVEEIDQINQDEREAVARMNRGTVDPDAAVSDGNSLAAIDRRRDELHARIRAATVTVTVWAMIRPEINEAVGKLTQENELYWPSIFAKAVEFPGKNTHYSPDQWLAFWKRIGEGQMGELVRVFNKVSFQKPKVDVPF